MIYSYINKLLFPIQSTYHELYPMNQVTHIVSLCIMGDTYNFANYRALLSQMITSDA